MEEVLSDEAFCGTICAAAKKLSIALSEVVSADKRSYVWTDFATNRQIQGGSFSTQKEALTDACKVMQNYLSAIQ